MDYIIKYFVVHAVCSVIGLSTKIINRRYLQVSDLLWSLLFGPFYMLSQFHDLDVIVIDLRKSKS